ncbi:MAG: SemiSWEET transporter [Ignavibacteriae bacterium]|nr:SemiSWEET transporter [Ignavibacteriota bacterium]
MDFKTIIGLFAAFCTTFAFLPQLIKVWKNKHAKDISLRMYIMFISGIILWFVYGVLISSLPVIIANSVTFILASIILVFKIKYG